MPAILSKKEQNEGKLKSNPKWNWFLLYISYFSAQSGRGIANMALTLGASRDGAMTLDQTTNLITWGSFAYTFGKIFGGSCADILGGKKTITMVMMAMGASFLIKGFSANNRVVGGKVSARFFTFMWCVSRVFHALHWPAHCVVNKSWFSMDTNFSSMTAILSTCSRLGSFSGSILGGFLLSQTQSWSLCLKIIGTYLLGIGALDAMTMLQPKNKEKDDDDDNNNNTTKVVMMREKKVKPGAWIRALTNPKLYLYVFTLSILYIYIFPCKPNANILIILYLLLQSICWKCFGVPCI